MNERIQELAIQASKDNSDGYPVTLEYSNRFAEKFAELIVRECMALGDKALQDGKWPGDVLKKHFGVDV